MKTFVRSSSKGLAEVTRNKASEVQFIHESVRDFLLGRYGSQWSEASGSFEGHGHQVLRDGCLAQLERAAISQDAGTPDASPHASKAALATQSREAISLKFPFLGYSVLNVLPHANSALQHGMDQAAFLDGFPLRRLVIFNDTLERYAVRRYGRLVSLLYVLAEKNLADLIKVYPRKECCFDLGTGRYGGAIFAALASGNDETVQALLRAQVRSQPSHSPLHDLCKQYTGREINPTGVGSNFVFQKSRSVLSNIVDHGDPVILAILLGTVQVDVEKLDSQRWTPLGRAAIGGNEAVVKLLLEKGAKVEWLSNDEDGTPLRYAIRGGHHGVVRLLLENGANIERVVRRGMGSLLYAVDKGHETVVKVLLENGAQVNARTLLGRTPLSLAASHGHEAIMRILLENGADIDGKDGMGKTPLSSAILSEDEAAVQLLIEKGAKVDAKDFSGLTPLSVAICNGHEAIMRLLLENGADIEEKDGMGQTPLLSNSRDGHEAVVQLLLEKGAQVNARTSLGRTPLSLAATNGHEAIIKLLLEKGGEVGAECCYGRTTLSYAAGSGYEAVVKLLLEKGARAESKDRFGRTPLWFAASRGHRAVVEQLLEKGARIDVKDEDGWTPLSRAMEEGHEDIVKLLAG
jgi:ankyrin repeat protein